MITERTRTGLEILKVAAVIGIFGNIMLRVTPWGLNAFLFVAAFVGVLYAVTRRRRPDLLTLNRVALLGAMVFFGAMFVLRNSIELRVYDTLAILVIMGVLLLGPLGINERTAGTIHYGFGFIWSGISSLLAPVAVLSVDVDWKQMPGNTISRMLFSVLRGLAVTMPLLLIFGALFAAADANFQAMVDRLVTFDLDTVLSHVAITSVLAWCAAGYLRSSIVTPVFPSASGESHRSNAPASGQSVKHDNIDHRSFIEKVTAEPGDAAAMLLNNATILDHINRSDPPNPAAGVPVKEKISRDWQNIDSSWLPSVFTLGTIETVMILGLIDLLFVTFVSLQLPYLFGGMDLVQNTPDFKLAEYARRGFGELVVVALLVLPILLVSHWLLRKEVKSLQTTFRVLAVFQIALVFVIMASAAQRLILLTGDAGYGLTTVRFYPMVFMLWLAVVFGWFAITVLRGARNNFAWGALWSAIVVLAATNLLNPDAFIARTNIALMKQGREFDAYYNAQLSDDAIPTVLSALPALSERDRCSVKRRIDNRLLETQLETDLRSWNWSRVSARALLEQHDSSFQDHDGCPAGFPVSGGGDKVRSFG